MGFESYISESEAATIAGVGVTTLRRFAEAGYFKIETESDGLKLYARSDLERVFGVKSKPAAAAQPIPQFPSSAQVFQAWTPPKETISPESNGAPISTPSSVVAVSAESTSIDSTISSFCEKHEEPEAIPVAQKVEVESKPEPIAPILVTPPLEVAPQQAPTQAAAQPVAQPQPAAIELLDRELHKQRTISEMHERLLQMREEEIRGLKDERDWLRARIEKLEEKGARDQVLLLSETQTIKALITIQEQRRSPVRLALEWLGFVTPPPMEQSAPRSAIDITHNTDSTHTKKAA